MYSERLQLLLTPALRERLQLEARRRGVSVAEVARGAIDVSLTRFAREDRVQAVAEIAGMHAAFLPVEELERVIAAEREEPLARLGLEGT